MTPPFGLPLLQLVHRNIIEYVAAYENQENLAIVTELMDGDLYKAVVDKVLGATKHTKASVYTPVTPPPYRAPTRKPTHK